MCFSVETFWTSDVTTGDVAGLMVQVQYNPTSSESTCLAIDTLRLMF